MSVSFILFRTLPITAAFENDSMTVAASGVIAATVGAQATPTLAAALVAEPVVLNFGFEEIGEKSSHICVYWNFSDPLVLFLTRTYTDLSPSL